MVLSKQNNAWAIKGARKSLKSALLIAGCIMAVSGLEASAGESAAIALKVDGETKTTVNPFSVMETEAPIQLDNDTTIKFRHFVKCQTVIVKGGLLDFDPKNYKLSGGKTISADRTRCLKKVPLSRGTNIGGLKLRSGSTAITVTTRPTFILTGEQSDAFKAIKVSKGGKLVLEGNLNGRVFLYPAAEPDLEHGQRYKLGLVPKEEDDKLRHLKILAKKNPGNPSMSLINTD